MGTLSRQSFKWEHSAGKVLNGNTLQAKFSMGTLSRQSFKLEHSPGKFLNGNIQQAKF